MPIWVWIYGSVLLATTLFSLVMYLLDRKKEILNRRMEFLFQLYDFLSVLTLIFLVCAYYRPEIRQFTGIGTVAVFIIILATDFYLSVFSGEMEATAENTGISPMEYEIAKGLSILYTAPAYLIGALLSAEIIFR